MLSRCQALCLPGRLVPVDQTAVPLLQTIAVITAATRSVNLATTVHQDTRSGKALARTPFSLNYKTRSHSHSVAWEDIFKFMATSNPALLFWVATMEKTTQRFQRIATTIADLNAEGLNAQSGNDFLTMYVCAASQHVLRMNFVPEQEAHNFNRQVTTFWSHLIQRDIASPFKNQVTTCSHFPSKAMLWIKEVEMVGSLEQLKSSGSVSGKDFPNFEMLGRENCFCSEQDHPEFPIQEEGQSGGTESPEGGPVFYEQDRSPS